MTIKVGHIADVHIRGFRYFDEIEYTFSKLYESLKKENVDLIIIGGDTYHSKLTVTNEYFECCAKFFRELSDIAEVLVILGNHDLAMDNRHRMNAVSPVILSLGETKHPIVLEPKDYRFKDNFVFNTLSILDEKKNWPNQDTIIEGLESGKYKEDDIHVALYHGSINKAMVDSGWVSRGNKDGIDIFAGFDYAMLGDIHKYQQLTPRVVYPGSLRQNNYGEDPEKGYVVWNIDSKDDWTTKRIVLPQKRYFYTINLDPDTPIPDDLDIKKDCRIRVKLQKRVNISDDLKIRESIKRIYKPCNDVTTIPPDDGIQLDDLQVGEDFVPQENLRNLEVQRALIKEFFKNEKLDKDILESLYRIDEKFNSYLDKNVARNVIWRMKEFKFENIFSYGKGNKINFSKVNGLVGIFGKNTVGKSSILDALCYTIFDKINKEGANKNEDFINNRKKKCLTHLHLDFHGTEHHIERSTKRPKEEGRPPTNTISFFKKVGGKNISLAGETKPDTNRKVRNKLGELKDFNTTSICSQEGLLQFLKNRGTDKKKLFATFLDLNIFEKKYALADKEIEELKAKVKEYGDVDFHSLIEDSKQEIEKLNISVEEATSSREKRERSLQDLNDRIATLSAKIKDVVDDLSLDEINRRLIQSKLDIKTTEEKIEELSEYLNESADLWAELDDHIEELGLIEKKLEVIKEVESDLVHLKKKSQLLETVPCDDQFPTCPFIVEAHKAKTELRNFDESRLDVKEELQNQRLKLIQLIDDAKEEKNIRSEIENLKLKLENLELKQDSLQNRKREIEKNQGVIKENHELYNEISELKKAKDGILLQIGELNKEIFNYTKTLGSKEEQLRSLQDNKEKVEKQRHEYHCYQLYLKAMGKNGISYKIISQRLPLINAEVNRILSQVSDLSLLMENNEDKKSIDMYLMGGNKGKRIIELGSGFEKTMVSLALRAALWSVSSLPKTPVLFLDEPFAFVEEDKIAASVRMLKYLKNYFEHVFIISHDNNLKSMVDSAIYISNDDAGFAQCNVA